MANTINTIAIDDRVLQTNIDDHKSKDYARVVRLNYGSDGSLIDIDVVFEKTNDLMLHCSVQKFERGSLRNYFAVSVAGVGYLGEIYAYNLPKNFTQTDKSRWTSLISKSDIPLSEEFKNFSKFVFWLHTQDNYVRLKDNPCGYAILSTDEKIYSPSTCYLVPYILKSAIAEFKSDRKNYSFSGLSCDLPRDIYYGNDGSYVTARFTRELTDNSFFYKDYDIDYYLYDVDEKDREYFIGVASYFFNHTYGGYCKYSLPAIGAAMVDLFKVKQGYFQDILNDVRDKKCISESDYQDLYNWVSNHQLQTSSPLNTI